MEPATRQTSDIRQRVSLDRTNGAAAVIAEVARHALAADPRQRGTTAVALQVLTFELPTNRCSMRH
jgi:hypothetical protein